MEAIGQLGKTASLSYHRLINKQPKNGIGWVIKDDNHAINENRMWNTLLRMTGTHYRRVNKQPQNGDGWAIKDDGYLPAI